MQAKIGPLAVSVMALGLVAFTLVLGVPSVRPAVFEAVFESDSDDLWTEFMYSSLFTLACLGLVGAFDYGLGTLFVGRWFAVRPAARHGRTSLALASLLCPAEATRFAPAARRTL